MDGRRAVQGLWRHWSEQASGHLAPLIRACTARWHRFAAGNTAALGMHGPSHNCAEGMAGAARKSTYDAVGLSCAHALHQ